MECKAWTHVSTECTSDLLESEPETMIPDVLDNFATMVHFVPIKQNHPPIIPHQFLENVWNYHRFPEDKVSDGD